MNYESETEPRNFFFFLACPSLSLSLQRPLQRLFVRCLKVFVLVALKALDRKESFGIMVILQVVKRNTNGECRRIKNSKRIHNFAHMLNASHSVILDYHELYLFIYFYFLRLMIGFVDDSTEKRAEKVYIINR